YARFTDANDEIAIARVVAIGPAFLNIKRSPLFRLTPRMKNIAKWRKNTKKSECFSGRTHVRPSGILRSYRGVSSPCQRMRQHGSASTAPKERSTPQGCH